MGICLMSLSENQEIITKIGELRLPVLPYELGSPQRCEFLHIGGHKACLVVTEFDFLGGDASARNGTDKIHGAVIPFQFEVDITKVDKDKKNCLTLQFMPLRSFEYHTNPSNFPAPETAYSKILSSDCAIWLSKGTELHHPWLNEIRSSLFLILGKCMINHSAIKAVSVCMYSCRMEAEFRLYMSGHLHIQDSKGFNLCNQRCSLIGIV
ncbi:uncharacterized protein LOC133729740 [Rosa rugosa]|uniref:uncharacterized protein LOC133729740 n=1 Tax=Rosa rugosa TaxID=74645 RepID=UPI002B40FC01|nr:uncharacterized protein LOC133729740 [Rosa rugosa]